MHQCASLICSRFPRLRIQPLAKSCPKAGLSFLAICWNLFPFDPQHSSNHLYKCWGLTFLAASQWRKKTDERGHKHKKPPSAQRLKSSVGCWILVAINPYEGASVGRSVTRGETLKRPFRGLETRFAGNYLHLLPCYTTCFPNTGHWG